MAPKFTDLQTGDLFTTDDEGHIWYEIQSFEDDVWVWGQDGLGHCHQFHITEIKRFSRDSVAD